MSGPALGASLELPDWLKAAAEATPELPGSSTRTPATPPAGFHVAPPAANIGTNELFSPRPAAVEPPAAKPAPLPPVPSGNLSDSLPEWLRQPTAPQHPPAPRPAAPEPANPASFISENDLPEWIRQIAAADEAKRQEEERLAAEATLAQETTKRAALPGEAVPATVANPWLARRDQAAPAQAWGAAAPTDTPSPRAALDTGAPTQEDAPEVVRVEPDASATAAATGKKAKLGKRSVSAPKLSVPKLNLPSAQLPSGREAVMRYALFGAVALLLLVLIVAMVL